MALFDTPERRFDFAFVEGGCIPTAPWLVSCEGIIPIFDVLGPTAFMPVKADVNGNICKLRAKLESNVSGNATLQSMVNAEIAAGTTTASGSATDALLWLKRGMTFVRVMLEEVLKGNPDLPACVTTAYERTLRKFHNFIVRGIFSVALYAVPDRVTFMQIVGKGSASEEDILRAMRTYVTQLSEKLANIDAFYALNKLDS